VLNRRVLILLAIILGVAANRLAQVRGSDWPPINPEELRMTSVPEAPGAPAVILYRQVDREDKLFGSHEHVYARIKVLTEDGRKYGAVEIPSLQGKYDITSLRGRTVHTDGTVILFNGKIYDRTILKWKGLSYLAKVLVMPDVQVGSVIEYEYYIDYQDRYFYQEEWVLSDTLFTREAKFSFTPYTRHGFSVRWNIPAGLPEGVKAPEVQAAGIVRMEARNIPAFQTEDYMPPPSELKYRVLFIYSDGAQENDPDKFWKSFAKKQNGEIESFLGKRAVLEKTVAETVSAGDSAEIKLHKLYGRTQKITNVSYELRKTDEEKKREGIKPPNNVEELLSNGYGSKKQIDWLFLGLARAAGFEAYPLLLSNRKQNFFKKERMNTSELGFTAVAVKVEGREIYLDPGGEMAPYGLLPWEETGVAGLKLDKTGGTWMETNLEDSSMSEVRRVADLNLAEDGTLEGKLVVTFSGQEVYALRIDEMLKDEEAQKKFLEDKVKEYVAAGSEVELTNKPDLTSTSPTLVAEFHLKAPGCASISGKHAILPVGLFGGSEKHVFEHTNRTYAVYFEHPFGKTDEINIRMPGQWQVRSVPKPKTMDMKAARYDLAVTGTGNAVQIKRQLKIDFVLMDQKFYAPLRSFFQTVKTSDEQQVVLETGGATAAN
jgi:Domain of Unknown Function with PDB structure (DUF3857)